MKGLKAFLLLSLLVKSRAIKELRPIKTRAVHMSKDYKKDIFSILADGVELLHKRLRLLYITFNFKAADKNYLYFLF